MANDKIMQMLLRGLREAACCGHVTMFKHLLTTFPVTKHREDQAKVSHIEYDAYGWTPLHYAAALPDVTIYNDLILYYYGEKLWDGKHPGLIFYIAHGDHQSIPKHIYTEKEAVDYAQIIGENGEIVSPVIEAPKGERQVKDIAYIKDGKMLLEK